MNTTVKIILVIVALGLVYLAYRLIFKKPEDGTLCDSDGDGVDDGTYFNGACVKSEVAPPPYAGPGQLGDPTEGTIGLNPALTSVKVAKSQVSAAPNPSVAFPNMWDHKIADFNVLRQPGSNPVNIHFHDKFDAQLPQYIWYNKWIYQLITSNIVQPSIGERDPMKRGYYRVTRVELPSQIKVRILSPANSCPALSLFISGVEYKYSTTTTDPSYAGGGTYCTYLKK